MPQLNKTLIKVDVEVRQTYLRARRMEKLSSEAVRPLKKKIFLMLIPGEKRGQ